VTSAAFLLIMHALIHRIGTAVYVWHAQIKGLSYKTTLLSPSMVKPVVRLAGFSSYASIRGDIFISCGPRFSQGLGTRLI